jgi:hypothetical protein
MKSSLLAALFILTPIHQAFPWGQEGHSIVAEIAQRRLNPTTLQKINTLLSAELPSLKGAQFSLSSIASWADDYRAGSFEMPKHDETYNWHFVDIPYDRDSYDEKRDCKKDEKKGDCIINALARTTAMLADCSKSDGERAMALKFVVHFVGDLHQPLHAETRINPDTGKDDLGGNLILVKFLDQDTNLHKVWDTGLIMHKVYDWGEYARWLETQWLPNKDITALQAGDAISWAQDAHKAAQIVAYNFRPDHVLDEEYYKDAISIVDQQLALAGLRLARVLNEALKPTEQCP